MKVVWSEREDAELTSNLDYLEGRWGTKVAADFFQKLKTTLVLIQQNPQMYPYFEEDRKIRKSIIVKQITLYFKVEDSKILILSVFNNRQDPSKLAF